MSKFSISSKIKNEFTRKNILTLDELYSILSKDAQLALIMPNLKHRIRSSIYTMKKEGKLELINKATYKIILEKDFDSSV